MKAGKRLSNSPDLGRAACISLLTGSARQKAFPAGAIPCGADSPRFRYPALLEAVFQSELQSARTVCIDRMQERVTGETILAPWKVRSGRIVRSTITTDRVTSRVTSIWIVEAELRMVEDIKGFQAKFDFAAFMNREVLKQGHVKIQTARVI